MTIQFLLLILIIASVGMLALLIILLKDDSKLQQAIPLKPKPNHAEPIHPPSEKKKQPATKLITQKTLPAIQKVALHETVIPANDRLLHGNHDKAAPVLLADYQDLPKTINQLNTKPVRLTENATELVILHVMAPVEQPFKGSAVLAAVTACGLRFGKNDIFHYYDTPPSPILFSLCSAMHPGCFDLASINQLFYPGLSLFMQVPTVNNPSAVFKVMLKTAHELAEILAGYVYDNAYQPLTEETLHHYLTRLTK